MSIDKTMSDHDVLEQANDPSTTAELLSQLANNASELVRGAVARNPNTDGRTLLSLVGDSSAYVRESLAETNQNFDGSNFEFSACKNSKLALAIESDAEFILSLRLNPELNRHVSRVEANLQGQIEWLRNYKEREARRTEFYFIIKDHQDKKLGTVRLYDFRAESFCWGSWMVMPGSPRKTAIESALNVYEFAFYTLGFNASHFDVRNDNVRVIGFHERMGAEMTSSNELDSFFSFTKEVYEMTKNRYASFLS